MEKTYINHKHTISMLMSHVILIFISPTPSRTHSRGYNLKERLKRDGVDRVRITMIKE